MAELEEAKPYPPGRYPLVVVGSGTGGMQLTYSLSRLGARHAAISADDAPGGMFRKWPVFQRMLSWTKPYTGFSARNSRVPAHRLEQPRRRRGGSPRTDGRRDGRNLVLSVAAGDAARPRGG